MDDTFAEPDTPEEVDEAPRATAFDPPLARPKRDVAKPLLGLVAVLLVGVLVLQIVQLRQTDSVSAEVAALAEDVTDLKPLRRDVDILGEQVGAINDQIQASVAAAAGASPAAVATQGPDGALPAFQTTANDPAVLTGMKVADINGTEYYSAEEVRWVPSDGKARVYLVWAHWCPYCQAELPELGAWYSENAARFPNVELLTVTTAIGQSGDNPLVPYLDDSQFPFPVLVDESDDLAALFGTVAFPFYVATDTDGTVVLRVAGALGVASVEQIFIELESRAAG